MSNDRKPSHYLYAITHRPHNDRSYWVRIGAAWPTADGRGYSFRFDIIPLPGTDVAMREPKEEAAVE